MDGEPGRSLILWTVRISVAVYVFALYRRWFHQPHADHADRVYRLAWTSAWLMCVVHVLFAFHFQHQWDHAAALQHTADMTERVVGIHWAGGLFINYLFLTWWGIDVARLWNRADHRSTAAFHAVAVFMMFNATVVFGPAWWWIPFAIVSIGLIWIRFRRRTAAAHSDATDFP